MVMAKLGNKPGTREAQLELGSSGHDAFSKRKDSEHGATEENSGSRHGFSFSGE
jgi:hypothetical protein